MYTLPSRDIVVQTCRGVGQVLLYCVQNVWELGGWCGTSLIYPYRYLYCGPPVGFETTISTDERPQTHAIDRTATGTGATMITKVKTENVWMEATVMYLSRV